MFDDIFEKQTPRRRAVEPTTDQDQDELDDLGSFGFLRGVRDRAVSLEIHHKDGKITANSYAWLESAEFDPSTGVTLNFSGKIVRLIGQNLNSELRPNVRMFEGILRHRVPWIKEASHPELMQLSKGAVIIEEVRLK